jgi:hypothetical protein
MAVPSGQVLAALIVAATLSSPQPLADAALQIPGPRGPQPLPQQTLASVLDELTAVDAFGRRVDAYVTLHRLLEGPVPPLQVSKDMRVVRRAMDALAVRLQTARAGARQGDLFTTDVVPVFRRRILTALSPEDIQELLAPPEPGEPRVPAARLAVNARWPEHVPFACTPPRLLAMLPPLPPELEYRLIGRALVIWDHHADLIVDFLPGAFTT